MNPLIGLPLKYLIGANVVSRGYASAIVEVPWDQNKLPKPGIAIGYTNLFDEENSGKYPPYMADNGGTADEYDEGHIDPNGPGFDRNIMDQLKRRKAAGFEYIEQDNADSYPLNAVLHAIQLAQAEGLKVVAKNPGLGCMGENADLVVKHPNIYGIIVENGAGTPASMHGMRLINERLELPVWFVFYGARKENKAKLTARQCKMFANMFTCYSPKGEYTSAVLL